MHPKAETPATQGAKKLDFALRAFALDVAGWVCADFGCNVGGFTDCLLRAGAAKVFAVDTGYGQLAWRLRKDPRVVVMERTNALYCPVPEPVDLVVIDTAWTPQERSIPAAMGWLKPGGRIVSLLKPHYEVAHAAGRRPEKALTPEQSREVVRRVCQRLADSGSPPQAIARSEVLGKGGNEEFFLLLGNPSP